MSASSPRCLQHVTHGEKQQTVCIKTAFNLSDVYLLHKKLALLHTVNTNYPVYVTKRCTDYSHINTSPTHDNVTPTKWRCVQQQSERVRILREQLIQQAARSGSGEVYKMWHFMTKHQPTDLFLFCLLSDGSVFDGLIIGFQVFKNILFSVDAPRNILFDAGLCDNKQLIHTLPSNVFYLQ